MATGLAIWANEKVTMKKSFWKLLLPLACLSLFAACTVRRTGTVGSDPAVNAMSPARDAVAKIALRG